MMDPNDKSLEDYFEDNSYPVSKRQSRERKTIKS